MPAKVVRPFNTLPVAIAALTGLSGVVLAFDYLLPGDSDRLHMLIAIGLIAIGATAAFLQRSDGRHGQQRLEERSHLQELASQAHAAEMSNRAKSRYLASVSHEIRSPLNSIYGYAQLVERNDGVDAPEAARVIRRCAEHLNGLIDGLLDISQAEHGALKLRQEPVALQPFLDQVISIVRPDAAAKRLDLQWVTDGRLPNFVRMDQSRLRQVLINLLSNAIKFTDAGAVTLRVGYRADMVRLQVCDTGPGISAEDQERIFDPFQQGGDASVAADRAGVGLGLPIATALVEILGGKLELDSAPGAGSTFTITLRLPEATGKLEPGAGARQATGYSGRRRTILLAEDDPAQLAFLSQLLASLGFELTTANDGPGALALAERMTTPPDLALLDIAMPGLSGWDVAQRLRAQFADGTCIVMLSASAEDFQRPDTARPVHDQFLAKPVDFAALVETIGGLLDLSWTWTVPDNPVAPVPDAGAVPLNAAARGHVEQLCEFLHIGYLRGIEQELRALAQADPQAEPLVRQLTDALDRFDLDGMSRLLASA